MSDNYVFRGLQFGQTLRFNIDLLTVIRQVALNMVSMTMESVIAIGAQPNFFVVRLPFFQRFILQYQSLPKWWECRT
jgi:hypothetical protein